MNYVITSSPGNSGGGAVHDYLCGRNDFESPTNGEEIRIICDPYGIENLYQNFYDNFSINNAAESLFQFQKYCEDLNQDKLLNSRKVYGGKFYSLVSKYIKEIKKMEYIGLPQYKKISLKSLDKIENKINIKLFKHKHNQYKSYKMILPVQKDLFIKLSKNFLYNFFKSKIKSINKKNIILDQATNYWNPSIAFKYFDNLKIIKINRDPRSIFYSMKWRSSSAYPGYDVKLFIEWYKNLLKINKDISSKNNKNIMQINFEDFILKFDESTKKINKFLNIKKINNINFNIEKSKRNVFKAKDFLSKYEMSLLEKNFKNDLLW
tara:strand:- start:7793 stop:8755 length:963 start_codon:yes stop_codon:yes gene_type:complete